LLFLSATRLGLSGPLTVWLAGIGALAGMSLVAMTLGLGALLIDRYGDDPAKIVSSSSGALTLVLMLTYVGCLTGGIVLGWKAWAVTHVPGVLGSSALLLLLSVVFGYVPLAAGWRKLAQLEL